MNAWRRNVNKAFAEVIHRQKVNRKAGYGILLVLFTCLYIWNESLVHAVSGRVSLCIKLVKVVVYQGVRFGPLLEAKSNGN